MAEVFNYIVGELLVGRLKGVEQAGAAMEGVQDALVIKWVGVEDAQVLVPACHLFQSLQAPFKLTRKKRRTTLKKKNPINYMYQNEKLD